jgi:hypothetical protein
MSGPPTPRKLDDDSVLLRVVWDEAHDDGGVHPEAFIDKYSEQSFFFAGVCPPSKVMEKFANMPHIQKRFSDSNLDKNKLYDQYNVRIAPVTLKELKSLRCSVKPKNGHDYDEAGHVNIVGVKDVAEELAESVNLLSRDETLS